MPRTVDPVVPAGTLRDRDQPVLDAGDGIALRPWSDDDAEAVVQAFADPAVELWHLRTIASTGEARRWVGIWRMSWHAETDAAFAVSRGDALLGYVALRTMSLAMGAAEVSYWTRAAARGLGVAPRAVRRLARFAFDDVGLERLGLMHSTLNAPSCRVAVKAGFAPEGVARRALLHTDGWHDMHRHGRLSGDEEPVVS